MCHRCVRRREPRCRRVRGCRRLARDAGRGARSGRSGRRRARSIRVAARSAREAAAHASRAVARRVRPAHRVRACRDVAARRGRVRSRESAPTELRPAFASFARDLSASGHFDSSALRLKTVLADPVADRIVETLRMARQVGGTELTPVLRALAASVRADAALRGEVEARQSWIRGAAVLGVAAPWVILALLALRPEGASRVRESRGRRADPRRCRRLGRRVPRHDPARVGCRSPGGGSDDAISPTPIVLGRRLRSRACACCSRSLRGGVRRVLPAGSRRTCAMSTEPRGLQTTALGGGHDLASVLAQRAGAIRAGRRRVRVARAPSASERAGRWMPRPSAVASSRGRSPESVSAGARWSSSC